MQGGEPDIQTTSKMILNDFQRGKLPFFVPPIGCDKEALAPPPATVRFVLKKLSNLFVKKFFAEMMLEAIQTKLLI